MINYVINHDTFIIMPYGNKQTRIIEKNKELIIDCTPTRIIKKNCYLNGSTLDVRQKWTESLIGDTYKVPVALRDDGDIIIFPTSSPRLKNVSWIILNNVKKSYKNFSSRESVIEFVNNYSIILDVSNNILTNQLLKATRLEYVLRKNRTLYS